MNVLFNWDVIEYYLFTFIVWCIIIKKYWELLLLLRCFFPETTFDDFSLSGLRLAKIAEGPLLKDVAPIWHTWWMNKKRHISGLRLSANLAGRQRGLTCPTTRRVRTSKCCALRWAALAIKTPGETPRPLTTCDTPWHHVTPQSSSLTDPSRGRLPRGAGTRIEWKTRWHTCPVSDVLVPLSSSRCPHLAFSTFAGRHILEMARTPARLHVALSTSSIRTIVESNSQHRCKGGPPRSASGAHQPLGTSLLDSLRPLDSLGIFSLPH